MTPMVRGTGTGLGSVLGARALQAVMVAIVVGIVSFAMMQALPGDAAFRIVAAVTPHAVRIQEGGNVLGKVSLRCVNFLSGRGASQKKECGDCRQRKA